MKKLFNLSAVLFISLMAVAVVSCDDDEIPDIPDAAGITVSVNPGSLYESLGVLEDMAAQLIPTGKYIITDSVLVYNQSGAMITKSGVASTSFDNKEITIEGLPEGKYTLVLWQTTYREHDGVRAWKIQKEEDLSAVNISSDGGSFGFEWAVGYATATLNHGDNASKVTLTPSPIGLIIDATIENVDESLGYNEICLYTGKHHRGFYLDPAREDDHWIVETDSEYAGTLLYIHPEDQWKRKFFTLFHGQDYDLGILGYKADGSDGLGVCPHKTLAVGENYTFYLDVARKNWQPPFFGSAEDFTPWKEERDAGNLVFGPCTDWGCNVAHIDEYIHQKNWWRDIDKTLVPTEDVWYKSYQLSDSLSEYYYFETEDGQNLEQVICYCGDPSVTIDDAVAHIQRQGYTYKGKIVFPDHEPFDIYFSADETQSAYIQTFEGGTFCISYQLTDPEDQIIN